MIIQCKDQDIETVFDYIGEDYGKCLYIFIDLKKFGLDDENFDVWIQYNKEGAICAIISEYFGGIQIYSREQNLLLEEIADFIKEKDTHVLFAIKPIIDRLKPFLPGYEQETGTVGELMELKYPPNPMAYSAPMEELAEIVRIVADDEGIGKPYGYDSLYEQYTQRKEENFGRNFVLRDEETNEIICHAGTYAELPELAVIGGVITAPAYRGKGFSKETLSSLCEDLLNENKRIFSFFYIPSAEHMHYGVGFEKIEDWSKLFKD